MSYNHSQLATELGVSLRTLDNHRNKLQTAYGIELIVKQGRTVRYLDSFLSLIQASVNGDDLPETLAEWSYPAFKPQTTVTAEMPSLTVNAEIVPDDSKDIKPGSLIRYEYAEPVKLAISDLEPIDLSFMVKRADLSGLQNARHNALETLRAIDDIRLELVRQMAEKEGDEIAEMYTSTVATKVAKAKAQAMHDALGNG